MPAVDDVLLRDAERLASVERAWRVMPRLPVPLDNVAGLAARLLDAPIGEVTLLAADEEYFAGVWGAPESLAADRRQSVAYSVCKYAVSADHPVGSGDMWADPELRRHPLVTPVRDPVLRHRAVAGHPGPADRVAVGARHRGT
jgi:hypothetical protein